MEGIAAGRMMRSRRGKLYIDTTAWGPEADSIESGYRVPIKSIHLFIGRADGSEPKLDSDVPTEHVSQSPTRPAHAFIGFVNRSTE